MFRIVALAGAIFISYGIGCVYRPYGFISFGVFLLVGVIVAFVIEAVDSEGQQ